MKLRVIQAFAGYATGDEITDQTMIASILLSEQSAYVVQVVSDDEPAKTAKK